MKPFVFKLEALRKIRLRKEEEQQQQLAIAAGKYKTALEDLKMLQQRFENLLLGSEKQKSSGTTISMLIAYETYLQNLQSRVSEQAQFVNELNEERQAALQALEEAMKERKAVDKLKSRRLDAYQELLLQEEQKLLDEIAGAMTQRHQGSDKI